MSRFDPTLDSPEGGFQSQEFTRGLMQTRPGDRLPEGYYKRLINGEIRNGYPENRRGVRPVNWMNNEGSALAQEVQAVQWWQPVRAGDLNQPPSEVLLIGDNKMWRCAPNNTPKLVNGAITSDVQDCEIIPAMDVAIILRGLGQDPVLWDPYNQLGVGGGVLPLPTPLEGSGRIVIPPAETGCYTNDRLWTVYNGDQVIVSDSLEFWYNPLNVLRVESGAGSKILRMVPYGGVAIAVFKTDGVYRIVNTDGDLSNVYIEKVYSAEGCIAANSIARLASMFLYLSSVGVEAIQVSGNELISQQTGSFSASANNFFKGLASPGASTSKSVAIDNYYLWAIPSQATFKIVSPGGFWGPTEPGTDYDNGATYDQIWITDLT